MTYKYLASIGIASALLGGCVTTAPAPTALQIQAVQTKEFDTNKSVAFASAMSVFQDLGYIISSASESTGFITASSPNVNKTNFWDALGGVSSNGKTKVTAFVEEIRPGHTTVRLDFVSTQHKSGLYGQTADRDTPITNPKPYQIAFNKIGDAVFIRSGAKSASSGHD